MKRQFTVTSNKQVDTPKKPRVFQVHSTKKPRVFQVYPPIKPDIHAGGRGVEGC